MKARRILTAAIVTAAAALGVACSSPTTANFDGPDVAPTAPPTDTTGFVPPATP
ncbi:MAG TPA: hypothetical protein VFQ45_07755 [Longimicrobium sp.]|nr:hypothetical protein [Longimicrobium sp.]